MEKKVRKPKSSMIAESICKSMLAWQNLNGNLNQQA
jgi:hypothetical protein